HKIEPFIFTYEQIIALKSGIEREHSGWLIYFDLFYTLISISISDLEIAKEAAAISEDICSKVIEEGKANAGRYQAPISTIVKPMVTIAKSEIHGNMFIQEKEIDANYGRYQALIFTLAKLEINDCSDNSRTEKLRRMFKAVAPDLDRSILGGEDLIRLLTTVPAKRPQIIYLLESILRAKPLERDIYDLAANTLADFVISYKDDAVRKEAFSILEKILEDKSLNSNAHKAVLAALSRVAHNDTHYISERTISGVANFFILDGLDTPPAELDTARLTLTFLDAIAERQSSLITEDLSMEIARKLVSSTSSLDSILESAKFVADMIIPYVFYLSRLDTAGQITEEIDSELKYLMAEAISVNADDRRIRMVKLGNKIARTKRPMAVKEYKLLLSLYQKADTGSLMTGSRQYLKTFIFTKYFDGEELVDIPDLARKEIEWLRQAEKETVFLPTTGCEIGFPVKLSEAQKEEIKKIEEDPDKYINDAEKSMLGRSHLLKALFDFFMKVEGDTILGVRPCSIDHGPEMDLRILPTTYPVTIKILDLYIKEFKVFTDDELIHSSYATTVLGLLDDWRGVLIAAASFYLDRFSKDKQNVYTVDGVLECGDGLSHPGAMVWKAASPRAETSATVINNEINHGYTQMTFNYHMLGLGFEKRDGSGNMVTEVALQYPGDYSRIAYLMHLAQNKELFNGILEHPLVEFYRNKFGMESHFKLAERIINAKLGDFLLKPDEKGLGAIPDLARFLRIGFFTKSNDSSAQNAPRDFDETLKLLLEHQEIFDNAIRQYKKLLELKGLQKDADTGDGSIPFDSGLLNNHSKEQIRKAIPVINEGKNYKLLKRYNDACIGLSLGMGVEFRKLNFASKAPPEELEWLRNKPACFADKQGNTLYIYLNDLSIELFERKLQIRKEDCLEKEGQDRFIAFCAAAIAHEDIEVRGGSHKAAKEAQAKVANYSLIKAPLETLQLVVPLIDALMEEQNQTRIWWMMVDLMQIKDESGAPALLKWLEEEPGEERFIELFKKICMGGSDALVCDSVRLALQRVRITQIASFSDVVPALLRLALQKTSINAYSFRNEDVEAILALVQFLKSKELKWSTRLNAARAFSYLKEFV
ncbi:MAG: hypothetical protein Q8R31_03660, partial [Candidatus Omnitrophota bacterium]|nr:hypothetical protein [Candidatus Omnitrophota bacterium]